MTGERRGRAAGERVVIVAVAQFALVGVLALAIVALTTGIASRRVGQREAIANARTTTVLTSQRLADPAMIEGLRNGDPDTIAGVDRIVRDDVLDDAVVRVKIWTAEGVIVYSDAAELIGSTFALGADEVDALRSGRIEAEVSNLDEPENRLERQFEKLLEVYLPIGVPGEDALLFEAYHRYDSVSDAGSQLWQSFAPIALGGLIVLELVQLPLAWSLARRLRERMREREALTWRALEASEVVRRQIASDLHDGVVQDLTGVAYGLSAAARRPDRPVSSAELDATAGAVRDATRALRSLVVDLTPASVDEGGLVPALEELARRMSVGPLEVQVDVDEAGPTTWDPAVDRLLYRAAQEGLRNAARHANAASAVVRVRGEGDVAVLEVIDDGDGFDPEQLAADGTDGHVGLRALRGVVTDAGGTVETVSAPGAGTTLRVGVPTP